MNKIGDGGFAVTRPREPSPDPASRHPIAPDGASCGARYLQYFFKLSGGLRCTPKKVRLHFF